MRVWSFVGPAALSALALSSCAYPGDGMMGGDRPYYPPAVPVAPAQPVAPPAVLQWNPSTESREWHAAASATHCKAMERLFQQQGLRIRLVERQRTNDPQLPIACIFDGPDADPSAERFPAHQHREAPEYGN